MDTEARNAGARGQPKPGRTDRRRLLLVTDQTAPDHDLGRALQDATGSAVTDPCGSATIRNRADLASGSAFLNRLERYDNTGCGTDRHGRNLHLVELESRISDLGHQLGLPPPYAHSAGLAPEPSAAGEVPGGTCLRPYGQSARNTHCRSGAS